MAHSTNAGTQQLDLAGGVIQKGCKIFDGLMRQQDLVLPPTPTKEDEPEESDEPLDVEEEAPGLA